MKIIRKPTDVDLVDDGPMRAFLDQCMAEWPTDWEPDEWEDYGFVLIFEPAEDVVAAEQHGCPPLLPPTPAAPWFEVTLEWLLQQAGALAVRDGLEQVRIGGHLGQESVRIIHQRLLAMNEIASGFQRQLFRPLASFITLQPGGAADDRNHRHPSKMPIHVDRLFVFQLTRVCFALAFQY